MFNIRLGFFVRTLLLLKRAIECEMNLFRKEQSELEDEEVERFRRPMMWIKCSLIEPSVSIRFTYSKTNYNGHGWIKNKIRI